MLMEEINVAEWFPVKSPSLERCKEGDLPLLNFSNLTCMPWWLTSLRSLILLLLAKIVFFIMKVQHECQTVLGLCG